MLHLQYTKRKIQTYKKNSIDNDIGWFFPNVHKDFMITQESSVPDFTFKDKWTESVLYTSLIYLGNKNDNYIRSYSKIQEVLAAIGGFAKFFHVAIMLIYMFLGDIYKNFALIESLPFNEDNFDLRKNEAIFIKNNNFIGNETTNAIRSQIVKSEMNINSKERIKFTIIEYILSKKSKRNKKLQNVLDKFESYKEHYQKKFDVIKYIELHKDFKVLKNVLLSNENNLLFKLVKPELRMKKLKSSDKLKMVVEKLNISKNHNVFNNNSVVNDPISKKLLSKIDKSTHDLIRNNNLVENSSKI
jgi:hypothetical protein